jgi:hypothetical protein
MTSHLHDPLLRLRATPAATSQELKAAATEIATPGENQGTVQSEFADESPLVRDLGQPPSQALLSALLIRPTTSGFVK